jgi:Cdc6-like AAA superfamily ATPase
VEEIEKFVQEVGNGSRKGCRFLMVTGSPGLGKTVSVSRALAKSLCPVVAVNANICRTLREVQLLIYQRLIGRKPARLLTTQKLARELITHNCTGPLLIYI